MANPSPQAVLDEFCGDKTKRGNVIPYGPIDLNNSAATIYKREVSAFPGDGAQSLPLQVLELQNVGLATVFVAINDDATAARYDKILKVDTALAAGGGGEWKLPLGLDVKKVTVFSAGATRVAVSLTINPANTRY